MTDIDYIIPMVFPSDELWRKDLKKRCSVNPMKVVRFRSWGAERLLVQCVRRNMPFVRDIIILLARESQVQPWMEAEDVRAVFHEEFIPKQYLPTFNSCTIEMFLHRIPGISEQFIYGNDDVFPLSPLQESDFFRDGKPCQHHEERKCPPRPNIFHQSCLGGINFVASEFGMKFTDGWLKGGHSLAPILKSTCEHLWERGARKIEDSVTPFRAPWNYNQYIYGWYQHFTGNYIDHAPKRTFLSVRNLNAEEMAAAIHPDAGLLCINDHESLADHAAYAEAVRNKIAGLFTLTLTFSNMNENTKIYICTHQPFECPVTNPVYEIADALQIFKDDRNDNGIDNLFYSELATYRHIAENYKLPKYVGFCHYRKYFDFLDEVPDLEALVEEHGCIATELYQVKGTVESHYGMCFNFADMDVMKAIVHERKPAFYPDFLKMLQGNQLYIANMFVMKRNDFKAMMRFVWDLLDRWLEVVGPDIKQRILDHRNIYLAGNGRGATVSHQFRIGGNLGERLVSAYIMSKYPEPKTFAIRYTEKARPHKSV